MYSPKALYFALLAIHNVQAQNALNYIQSDPDLSTLSSVLQNLPDFVDTIQKYGSLTIFAPTNAAFAGLNQSSLESIAVSSGDVAGIQALLLYHLLDTPLSIASVSSTAEYHHTLLTPGNTIGNELAALVPGGQYLGLQLHGTDVVVKSGLGNNARITQGNIELSGTIIHKIDSVLTLPASFSATSNIIGLHSFNKALETAGLTGIFDYGTPSTIFAPTDAALSAVANAATHLTTAETYSLLKNHIVVGDLRFTPWFPSQGIVKTLAGNNVTLANDRVTSKITVNTATVTVADLIVKNGVVQVIDSILDSTLPLLKRSVKISRAHRKKML